MIVDPKTKQECPHLIENNCQIAELLSGVGRKVPVLPIHCQVCKQCEKPMADNHVTASLAVGSVREHVPQLAETTLWKLSPLLKREKIYPENYIKSYLNSTAKWLAAGCPTRSNEQCEQIMQICRECPNYRTNQFKIPYCGQCGCYLNASSGGTFSKARRATETCPLGKWEPIDNPQAEKPNENNS